jgi:hypothetical protein
VAEPFRPGPVPQDALDYFKAKDLRVGFSYQDVWGREHAHAFTVAKAMQLDLLDDMKAAVQEALAEGKTYREFARDLTPTLQHKGWWGRREMTDPATGELIEAQLGSPRRLRTIYRANMRSARAAGQWQRIQRSKAARPFLLYGLGPSEKHRPEHVSWAGTLLPVDHPWWQDHAPPNGWGCKCQIRQVGRREAERLQRNGMPDATAPQEINPETGLPTGRREVRRIPVRTEAPPRQPRQFVNKRTGETMTVDAGLDPAWAGNPGQDRARVIREQLTGKVDSADQVLARSATRQVMESTVLDDWVREPRGELPAGVLTRNIQAAVGARSQVVRLSADTFDKQSRQHADLTPDDYRRLPLLLAEGIAIQQDDARVVLFRRFGERWWKAVVKRTGEADRLYLVSFHRANARELRREQERGTVLRSQEE